MGCVPDKNQIRFVYHKPRIANIHKKKINITSEEDTENHLIVFSVCEDDGESCDSIIRKQVILIENNKNSSIMCKCT